MEDQLKMPYTALVIHELQLPANPPQEPPADMEFWGHSIPRVM